MALGGGSFTAQNKELPGAYINFVSAAAASATLSERGIATMPLELEWGIEGDVFTVTNKDFQEECRRIFGYEYKHEKMKGLRDLFLNIHTLHAYRLNSGGTKAENEFAEARYTGARGNDIKIVIRTSVEDESLYDVITMLDSDTVDVQTVASGADLTGNAYVTFKENPVLTATASAPLSGGTNGIVGGSAHQEYLNKIESYKYNTMGVVTTDDTTKKLYAAFNKRLREEQGIKFQLVVYNLPADYMGIISVKNKTKDVDFSEASLVYWVTGAESGCQVNKSCQNKKYDGFFTVDANFTQAELITAIKNGQLVLHRVNSDIRVLEDINTMVTTSDTCGDVFKENQTVRVMDHIANADAVLFYNKYLGVVPNDESGRISLWSDLVKNRQALLELRAIENFTDSDVIVEAGSDKKSVVANSGITVVNTMSKLYMTIVIG